MERKRLRAESVDVERIIREDVFYADGLANYEICSLAAKKVAKSFADFAGK